MPSMPTHTEENCDCVGQAPAMEGTTHVPFTLVTEPGWPTRAYPAQLRLLCDMYETLSGCELPSSNNVWPLERYADEPSREIKETNVINGAI